MCSHQRQRPPADHRDRNAARTVAFHPEQGWNLLCNEVIVFDDMGEILPGGQVNSSALPCPRPAARRGVKRENWRRTIMHPMFVTLFIEADADELLTEEQDRKRHAHAARRGRSARVIMVAAANPDRPRRP
jgi:hypothetical protein